MAKKLDQLICPCCKKPKEHLDSTRNDPFCSDRCRMVDLGQWLKEKYVIEEEVQRSDNDEPK